MPVPSSAIGQFVIGQSPIQGSVGTPQTLQQTILAYLYEQYADDADLQAFVDAYNSLTQGYLDWFNQNNLAIYTGLSGYLLDWVGSGLYGYPRPVLTSGTSRRRGPFNTAPYDTLLFNGQKVVASQNVVVTTDDIYKRCLTWNFYKGDGFYFTTQWLKRRVVRFLVGAAGTSPPIDQTYEVSVTHTSPTDINIAVTDPSRFDPNVLSALTEGILSGALGLPFQFQFTVTAGGAGFIFGVSGFGVGGF